MVMIRLAGRAFLCESFDKLLSGIHWGVYLHGIPLYIERQWNACCLPVTTHGSWGTFALLLFRKFRFIWFAACLKHAYSMLGANNFFSLMWMTWSRLVRAILYLSRTVKALLAESSLTWCWVYNCIVSFKEAVVVNHLVCSVLLSYD